MTCLHAYTEPGSQYPAYISINDTPAGDVTVAVRSAGNEGRSTATIVLTKEQMRALAEDVLRKGSTP